MECRYVEPRVGDGVLPWSAAEQMPLGYDVPFRAVLFCLVGADDSVRPNSAALSLRGAPQGYLLRGAKRRGNPSPFHKSPPKSQQFPTKFCAPIQNMEISPETVAQGAEECYILTVNRIRAAPLAGRRVVFFGGDAPVGRDPCIPPPGTHFSAGHAGPALRDGMLNRV